MKNEKYHLIYKTTNTITNEYYIGMHSTYNIEDGYLGSGTKIKRSIHDYGEHNHIREILLFCKDRQTLTFNEKQIVTKELIDDPLCLNLRPGGKGGFTIEQQKENNRRSQISQKIMWNENSQWAKRRKHCLEQQINKARKQGKIPKPKPHVPGKFKHSSETKQHLSNIKKGTMNGVKNPSYGKKWYHNPLGTESGKFYEGEQPQEWKKGRIKKKRCISCNIEKRSNIGDYCKKCSNTNKKQRGFVVRKKNLWNIINKD